MEETRDQCPECGTHVIPTGHLGTGEFVGASDESPEPWTDVAECMNCGVELKRSEGELWKLATS
jgi:predicted RNA-binding Zn-ribbon protein involved in translation (DUF1610 family)